MMNSDETPSTNVRVWVAVGYRGVNLELKIDGEWSGVSLNDDEVAYLIRSLDQAKMLWGDQPLDDAAPTTFRTRPT